MSKAGLTLSAKQVLAYLHKHNSGSHRKIKAALGMPDGDYDDARQQLLGLGKAAKFACFAGGLKLSEPETNGKKAEPGKTGQEEQAEITQRQRVKLSKILFNAIPKEGTLATNHAVLQKVQEVAKSHLGLEVSRETYYKIRKELIDKGKVGKGVGYGGKVHRIEGASRATIVDPRNWTTTLSRIPGRIGPVFGRKAWQRSGDGSRRR